MKFQRYCHGALIAVIFRDIEFAVSSPDHEITLVTLVTDLPLRVVILMTRELPTRVYTYVYIFSGRDRREECLTSPSISHNYAPLRVVIYRKWSNVSSFPCAQSLLHLASTLRLAVRIMSAYITRDNSNAEVPSSKVRCRITRSVVPAPRAIR